MVAPCKNINVDYLYIVNAVEDQIIAVSASTDTFLPEIVRSLAIRKCHHDAHGNFCVFEIIDSTGTKQYYPLCFMLSKARKKVGLNLFITTALTCPEQPYAKNVKPVRYNVIATISGGEKA